MYLRFMFVISLLLWQAAPSCAETAIGSASTVGENDARQMQVLNAGAQLLREGRPAEAIENYFDKVIASYEATYPAGVKATYCGRSPTETLVYLMQAAVDKKASVVLGPTWCDAYYLRAYALIELGHNAQARESLKKAIAMSSKNSQYRSELASLDRREKNWKEAIAGYETASELARQYSPPETKVIELGAALRGKGYVLVELGRLEEAAATYKQCLEIDAADKAAIAELRYVQSRRQQQKPQ